MTSNRKLFLFVAGSVTLFLLFSILATVFHFGWQPFQRVNLISDIIKKDSTGTPGIVDDTSLVIVEEKPRENFNLYHLPKFITSFNTDTTLPSLVKFMQKLHELKSGKKRKIRIAYFGDSMIEGDLLTQTLRKLLQQNFGGYGVGFVPITSQVSQFRQSVIDNYSGGWQDDNFKSAHDPGKLFLSGHLFRSSGDWVQMRDQTVNDSNAIIEKSLLCGFTGQPATVSVNDMPFTLHAEQTFNRVVIGKDGNTGIKLSVGNTNIPVYGISFESDSGIFVDNFSFRGITGIEFARIDSAFLSAVASVNPYDLIVFQYGVNLLFRPNDKNFSWYARALMPVLRKFRNCFSETDILVVSTADRAFRYGGEYRSAIGIDSLIKVQALLAFESGCAFYNQFETMGGTNSIVDWAARKPSLANKDYVHPNHRGAELLGGYFYEALLNDYEKFTRSMKLK